MGQKRDRYDITVDNKFIVHANIPSYTALFENYDYTSSFYKHDINEKLVDIFWSVQERSAIELHS